MFSKDGCRIVIPPEEHAYTDAPNLNNLFYRGKHDFNEYPLYCNFVESEVHAKVFHDK